MNPETNRFESLTEEEREPMKQRLDAKLKEARIKRLLRPNGEPVPKHWTVFRKGEKVVIKNYTFKVAYIGETSILFEPVGEADMLVQGRGEER